MERYEKIVPESKYRYDMFSGYALAIQVAFILYFLSMFRYFVTNQSLPPKIDFIILLILFSTWIFGEIITKRLFVIKDFIPLLSKKEKIFLLVLLILWILSIGIIVLLFISFNSNPLVNDILRNESISVLKDLSK